MTSESSADSRNRNSSFILLGGRLAIDFANTAPAAPGATDALTSWGDLVAFLAATGTISLSREATLRDLVTDAELETSALRHHSLGLRSAIRQTLEARISGYALDPNCIAAINGILAYTEGYEQLEPIPDAGEAEPDWRMAMVSRRHGMEWLIAAIARSAAKLVEEGPPRQCAFARTRSADFFSMTIRAPAIANGVQWLRVETGPRWRLISGGGKPPENKKRHGLP